MIQFLMIDMEKEKFNPEMPENCLDKDGYPTNEVLEWIKNFDTRILPFEDFVESLRGVWWMSDWCFIFKRKYNGKRTLELHTGGWSGNEEIIYALEENIFFFPMTWKKTYRGGHYYFSIPCK
jgi:hypothetical protein